MGTLLNRVNRELSEADVSRIADVYQAWRGDAPDTAYADLPGFCKEASLEDLRLQGHALTPGRYVGTDAVDEDYEPFEEKMRRLVLQLGSLTAEGTRLEAVIGENLQRLGYGG